LPKPAFVVCFSSYSARVHQFPRNTGGIALSRRRRCIFGTIRPGAILLQLTLPELFKIP
jgi:hypothetical protein